MLSTARVPARLFSPGSWRHDITPAKDTDGKPVHVSSIFLLPPTCTKRLRTRIFATVTYCFTRTPNPRPRTVDSNRTIGSKFFRDSSNCLFRVVVSTLVSSNAFQPSQTTVGPVSSNYSQLTCFSSLLQTVLLTVAHCVCGGEI
jgi:hypothetical protein